MLTVTEQVGLSVKEGWVQSHTLALQLERTLDLHVSLPEIFHLLSVGLLLTYTACRCTASLLAS